MKFVNNECGTVSPGGGRGNLWKEGAGVQCSVGTRALDPKPSDDLGSRLGLSPVSCVVMGEIHLYYESLSPHSSKIIFASTGDSEFLPQVEATWV